MWKSASTRLLPPPGEKTSPPKAKIPGFDGASSTLKLDSQRNHLDHSSRRWSKLGSTPFLASEALTIREMFSIRPPRWFGFNGLRFLGCPDRPGETITARLTFEGRN